MMEKKVENLNIQMYETTITNTRSMKCRVGVTLENLPYILILVLAVGGLAIFVIRRRIFN